MTGGTLYICATPIGNLQDISARVLDTLREADLIAAEDTRHSLGLLTHYDIRRPMISYHEHNKYERAQEIVGRLLAGENVALITDAGTPVISDPGEVLVKAAREAGIPVTSLPGPCALITALTLSGLPARRFVFEGFLPMDKKERRQVLEDLTHQRRTMILYEAPHRLRRTLEELSEALGGDRKICLCRELTKIHEEAPLMTLDEAAALYKETEPRGEYVLVLEGRSEEAVEAERSALWESRTPAEHLEDFMAQGLTKKEAMKAVALRFGISKSEIYSLINKQAIDK
ncbi:MAG: 16S rRNA (cytidine(1402)-2'-O)-methyltransferase [Lachnospiraceae bacterium]|nr:16S rRNA (cytidine(1402)-2'-O)-methyltransferase [Lachnospiraceae bacterium]